MLLPSIFNICTDIKCPILAESFFGALFGPRNRFNIDSQFALRFFITPLDFAKNVTFFFGRWR